MYSLVFRSLIAALVLFGSHPVLFAQSKFIVEESKVHFYSSTPLEDIEANNEATSAVVDAETGAFSFRVPITSFVFKRSLMQEHFNENYLESHLYPNGTFKGKIEGDFSLTKDGVYALEAVGTLNIHGVEQMRRIPATITVERGVPTISSEFVVALEDHKIDVPKVVFYNIAENIDVDIRARLKPYVK